MRIGIFGGDTAGRTIDDVVADAHGRPRPTASRATHSPRSSGSTRWACSRSSAARCRASSSRPASCRRTARHPLTMAQQALTVQAASGGRFTPRHRPLAPDRHREHVRPVVRASRVRHMREYLAVLMPLLRDGKADVRRRDDLARTPRSTFADLPPVPVLVAALGPKMLELAGTVTDGTVTWMTGPATLADAHRAGDHRGRRTRGPARAAHRREPADLRHRRRRRGARARRPTTSRCTASCRRTAPCSTAKARPVRPTSRSSATRPRSRSGVGAARRRGRHRVRRVDLRQRATSAPTTRALLKSML